MRPRASQRGTCTELSSCIAFVIALAVLIIGPPLQGVATRSTDGEARSRPRGEGHLAGLNRRERESAHAELPATFSIYPSPERSIATHIFAMSLQHKGGNLPLCITRRLYDSHLSPLPPFRGTIEDARGCTPRRHTTTAMTDKRSTHKTPDPTSTWGPKWAGWELGESTHAEAGQHNALTSRLCPGACYGAVCTP